MDLHPPHRSAPSWLPLVLGLAGCACLAQTARGAPDLRRVVLSSGGVGQFEFEDDVEGAASLAVDVPLDQVDDVLKSLVVDDPAGPLRAVRLPGMQPLSQSFRMLPFQPEAFASAESLLSGLVGEAVRLPLTGARGRILAVSPFEVASAPGQTSVTRHRLTIATADGIESAVLEDTPDIGLVSEALKGQIATALSAIAAQRVQDRRTLVISLADGGHRHIRFGYVVPVPVWKTSYRLTLPAADTGRARLQAFAVVENLSGRDWHDVSVTLTSGRPVLFHTPLYQPLFVERPESPVAEARALVPPVDAFAASRALAMPAAAPAAAPEVPSTSGPQAQPPPSIVSQSVAQVEFRLAAPVSAGSGQSLLLPILDREMPASRISLYQPAASPVHPLVALRLRNDTAGALPPGPVTLRESHADGQAGYVGDARLPPIEPGEERFASFALDLGVTIETTSATDHMLLGATVAKGDMRLTGKELSTTTYQVTTPASAGREIVIERAKQTGFELAEPSGKDVTATPDAYRVTRHVPAGTTEAIRIVLQDFHSEVRALGSFDTDTMVAVESQGSLPEPIRQALQHAAGLRADIDGLQTSLAGLRQHVTDIVPIRSGCAATSPACRPTANCSVSICARCRRRRPNWPIFATRSTFAIARPTLRPRRCPPMWQVSFYSLRPTNGR